MLSHFEEFQGSLTSAHHEGNLDSRAYIPMLVRRGIGFVFAIRYSDEAYTLNGESSLFGFPMFDVTISRSVRMNALGWPASGNASAESCLGCNRSYSDLRRLSWAEAKRVFAEERELIARIEAAMDCEEEYSAIEEECYDFEFDLHGLDIGVASTVVALSAARCVPFSSGNTGAFGGDHHEIDPVAAFFARPKTTRLLLDVAATVNLGIENGDNGSLVAFADDIRSFRNFAEAIVNSRKQFDALQLSPSRAAKRPRTSQRSQQDELPL